MAFIKGQPPLSFQEEDLLDRVACVGAGDGQRLPLHGGDVRNGRHVGRPDDADARLVGGTARGVEGEAAKEADVLWFGEKDGKEEED